MMKRILGDKEMLMLKTELREYFFHRRSLHLVPLVVAGMFLMAWVYPAASPMAPVVVIVIAALEPQFNNILYRTKNELEAMAVLPLSWERIVLVKNLATILLVIGLIVLAAMALLYFSPDEMTPERWGQTALYIATILFPLLHFGNGQSVKRPRRTCGLLTNDVVEAIWILISLLLVSLPYYVFVNIFKLWIFSAVYAVAAGWFWYAHSVKATARHIEKDVPAICSRS